MVVACVFRDSINRFHPSAAPADSMLAWDGCVTAYALKDFQKQFCDADWKLFQIENKSVYPNERQVVFAEMVGVMRRNETM